MQGVKSFGEIVNNHNHTNLEYIVIIWENFISIVHRPFAKKLHTLKRTMIGQIPDYLLIYLQFTWGSFLDQRDLMLISRVRGSLPQELHSRSPFLGLDLLQLGARGDIILIEILQRLSLLQQGTQFGGAGGCQCFSLR